MIASVSLLEDLSLLQLYKRNENALVQIAIFFFFSYYKVYRGIKLSFSSFIVVKLMPR